MIVRLVEALLWFATAMVVALRLDRLWLRLRALRLRVGETVKISARFFQQERCPTHLTSNTSGMASLVVGDELTIDHFTITHPDDDHRFLIAPHHGRRA